ncbi:MAG: ABC transporter substrate-binding protein [Bacillati bacterium ANGP1]|uniref:ABC transporter substrate-binding protein n=1 Tax=Candidatus Segetimicrobium genomatis TaxID=2569760 RepID=A0A537J0R5_9BACT|nr:MAG: ABC transporter substrate-binding protein [Terrabacteria group bacterium ANGP1]
MSNVRLIVILTLALLTTPLAADPQQTAKVPRVGVLAAAFSPASLECEAFRQGLRDISYVEGENIAIEWRSAYGHYDQLPGLATELVRLKVDVIVTESTVAARVAKHATTTIPIVMAIVARPGGNITGMTIMSEELAAKRLQLLKEADPKVSRVAVLYQPATLLRKTTLKALEVAAPSLRVQLQPIEVLGSDELEPVFSAMNRSRADALFVVDDPMFFTHRMRLLELATQNRLPAIYSNRVFVDAGGLMSYGVNFAHMFRHAATWVDKILKGAKPGDLPVEQPTVYQLVINMKTAKALGLVIPQSLLLRADEVIR